MSSSRQNEQGPKLTFGPCSFCVVVGNKNKNENEDNDNKKMLDLSNFVLL